MPDLEVVDRGIVFVPFLKGFDVEVQADRPAVVRIDVTVQADIAAYIREILGAEGHGAHSLQFPGIILLVFLFI